MSDKPDPFNSPFGTLFGDQMTVATYLDGVYDYPGAAQPLENLSLHPASHVLHYASECFEGLKAHRQADGSLAIFNGAGHSVHRDETTAFVDIVERLAQGEWFK